MPTSRTLVRRLREEVYTQLHMWSGQQVATAVVELYKNSLVLSQCREHTDLTVKMDNKALHDIFVRFVGEFVMDS